MLTIGMSENREKQEEEILLIVLMLITINISFKKNYGCDQTIGLLVWG